MQTKSTPALPKVSSALSPQEKTEDFRDVRSRLKPTISTSKLPRSRIEDKDQAGNDHRNAEGKTSHHSPRLSEAENTLPKIRSDSLLPSPEKEHSKALDIDSGKGKGKETQTLAKDKAKGKEESRGRPRGPQPHVMDECRTVSEKAKPPHRRPGAPAPHGIEECRTISDKPREHECEWKEKYNTLKSEADMQRQPDDIGLEGLTIVLHMKGRDDLVINTDLRNLE